MTFFSRNFYKSIQLQSNIQLAERSYKFYKGYKNINVPHAHEQDYANLKKVAKEVKQNPVFNWHDICK